jgi:hypothetical protein
MVEDSKIEKLKDLKIKGYFKEFRIFERYVLSISFRSQADGRLAFVVRHSTFDIRHSTNQLIAVRYSPPL